MFVSFLNYYLNRTNPTYNAPQKLDQKKRNPLSTERHYAFRQINRNLRTIWLGLDPSYSRLIKF